MLGFELDRVSDPAPSVVAIARPRSHPIEAGSRVARIGQPLEPGLNSLRFPFKPPKPKGSGDGALSNA